jgi:hypothetical protein
LKRIPRTKLDWSVRRQMRIIITMYKYIYIYIYSILSERTQRYQVVYREKVEIGDNFKTDS